MYMYMYNMYVYNTCVHVHVHVHCTYMYLWVCYNVLHRGGVYTLDSGGKSEGGELREGGREGGRQGRKKDVWWKSIKEERAMTGSDLQCRECSVCPHSLWYLSSLCPHISNENCVTVASCSTGEGGGERGEGRGGRGEGGGERGGRGEGGGERGEGMDKRRREVSKGEGTNRRHTCTCTCTWRKQRSYLYVHIAHQPRIMTDTLYMYCICSAHPSCPYPVSL